jgi:hypothetical protein
LSSWHLLLLFAAGHHTQGFKPCILPAHVSSVVNDLHLILGILGGFLAFPLFSSRRTLPASTIDTVAQKTTREVNFMMMMIDKRD